MINIKKEYLIPKMKWVNVIPQNLLAGSITDDNKGNVIATSEDDPDVEFD